MNWNIRDRWLAKAVSTGGTHIVQTVRILVHAVARKCHADKPNHQEILVCSQSEKRSCSSFVCSFFETSCWELNSSCFIKQTMFSFLSSPSLPSVTCVHFLPFCRCRCSRQYHRCTCMCLYLRVQESHVILKNTKKYTKNIQKISFLGQSFLQVLMNIFLNPYKFYVFNIS